jgi:uncharacterized oxidoreductase
MQLASNTILVTGGASGIGLALADRFARAGSTVIVCGRRADKLTEAQGQVPALKTITCDLSTPDGRVSFASRVTRDFPALDVLVNNAGMQRYPKLTDNEDWAATHEEIAINLEAPIHLTRLLMPHLLARPRAAVVNVTSGLSFVPLARAPIYCATKAALHSFTLSLRRQLKDTKVEVVEIVPPAVDTDLGGPGLHTFGVNVDEFADATMKQLAAGAIETSYGFAAQSSQASRAELDQIFERMNQ